MRILAGLGLLIVAGFVPQAGHAAGNVLLPQSSSGSQSSGSYSGLGLVPKVLSPSTPAQDQARPQPVPSPAAPSKIPSAHLSMPPAEEPAVKAHTASAATSARPTSRSFSPTRIVRMAPPAMPQKAPHVISISLSDRSRFSQNDFVQMSEKLGIRPDKAAALCTLSLRGALTTTDGYYYVDGGTSPRAQVGYSGDIVNQTLRTVAVCPSNTPVPQGAGVVVETSGSYIIPLRVLNCAVAIPRNTSGLVVKYDGEKTECAVQR